MNPDQITAFQSNGGFAPAAASNLFLSLTFVVLLVWGVWAIRTAYVGWAESSISGRQLFGVIVRFVSMYLVLTYFLLS